MLRLAEKLDHSGLKTKPCGSSKTSPYLRRTLYLIYINLRHTTYLKYNYSQREKKRKRKELQRGGFYDKL